MQIFELDGLFNESNDIMRFNYYLWNYRRRAFGLTILLYYNNTNDISYNGGMCTNSINRIYRERGSGRLYLISNRIYGPF